MMMTSTTRRTVLRSTLAAAAAAPFTRPFLANAATSTASVWWVQGFAEEEDVAFKKVVADYEKTSGNKLEYSIIPYAPERQKIVSAITSGEVPDLFTANPAEIVALYSWSDKLVDVSDVIDTQRAKYSDTALASAYCYNNDHKETQFLWCSLYRRGIAEPYLEVTGRKGRA